jgi:hypothetical protein
MPLNSLKSPYLIISKPESLFEVFDHLLNLPTLGIILDYIHRRGIKISGYKVERLLPFLFDYNYSHLANPIDLLNKLSHPEVSGLSIERNGDFSIRILGYSDRVGSAFGGKVLNNLFSQNDFCIKGATSSCSLEVVELCSEGKMEIFQSVRC